MKSGKAEIKINGQTYTITGEGTQAYLERLAGMVDKKVKALMKKDVMIDMEVASVLAAINIADEYQKLRSDFNELKKTSNTYAEELTDAKIELNNLKIENEILKLKIEKMKKNEKN